MSGKRILSGLPRLTVRGILLTTSALALLLAGCTDDDSSADDQTAEDATGQPEMASRTHTRGRYANRS